MTPALLTTAAGNRYTDGNREGMRTEVVLRRGPTCLE
jgi:hypothetical protein